MPACYTAKQLDKWKNELARDLPPEPTLEDLGNAKRARAFSFAGIKGGLLWRIQYMPGGKKTVFLNVTLAREILLRIHRSGETHRWELSGNLQGPRYPGAKLLPDEVKIATIVRSLRTADVSQGIMVRFADDRDYSDLFMRPGYAAVVMAAIEQAGKQERWWTEDFEIIPTTEG